MCANIDDKRLDLEVCTDNSPIYLNDDELYNMHECTLQMYRQNKICAKNAFNLKLLEYLPAILGRKGKISNVENDENIITTFQSVGATLDASAKIYAARIDSLYYETIKAQTLLKSNELQHREDIRIAETNRNTNHSSDDDGEDQDNIDSDFTRQKTKKSRILARKKTIINDRKKLLRKQTSVDVMPVMNTFFLSAMNNDNILLSELYEKLCSSKKKMKIAKEYVSRSKPITSAWCMKNNNCELVSTVPTSETLHIETTMAQLNFDMAVDDQTPSIVHGKLSPKSVNQKTMIAHDTIITPLSVETCVEGNTPLSIQSIQDTSLSYSSPTFFNTPPISIPSTVSHERFRSASICSNSIITNVNQLLSDKLDEYSYFDKTRLDEFTSKSILGISDRTVTVDNNEDSNHHAGGSQTAKGHMLKRKLSIEFPFLNQKKKMLRKTIEKQDQPSLSNSQLSVESGFVSSSDNDQSDKNLLISTVSSSVINDINDISGPPISSMLLSLNIDSIMTPTDCIQTPLQNSTSLTPYTSISCKPTSSFDIDAISPEKTSLHHRQSTASITTMITPIAGEKVNFLIPMIPTQKKQSIDVKNLQRAMHTLITDKINNQDSSNKALAFSDVYQDLITTHSTGSTSTSTNASSSPSYRSISVYFSALLNNAVLNKLTLTSNDQRDDIEILLEKRHAYTHTQR